jgi:hypothetical protein
MLRPAAVGVVILLRKPQIVQTTTQSTDTDADTVVDTASQPAYSSTSRIGETGQIYVLERLSLGPEKRLSKWVSETYDAQITLNHVLIDTNGTIYGKPTPNPAAILQFTANGTATGYLVYGDNAYQLESGNFALSLNTAQGGTLTLDRFNVTPLGTGQPDLGALRLMCPTLPTLGPAAAPIFVQTRHNMLSPARAAFLMAPHQRAAYWAVSLAKMVKTQGHSWMQSIQTRLNFTVISSPA